jgi:hypothetical protein
VKRKLENPTTMSRNGLTVTDELRTIPPWPIIRSAPQLAMVGKTSVTRRRCDDAPVRNMSIILAVTISARLMFQLSS